MGQTIIEWLTIIDAAGPLLEILLGVFGVGGGVLAKLFYQFKKTKDQLREVLDKSETKNEDLVELAKSAGLKWGLRELEGLLAKK